MAEASSPQSLVLRSSFIFTGTITAPGRSSLRVLTSRPGLAVARLDRGFLINPVLGNLDGRPITVRLAQEGAGAVRAGDRVVFFATAWVHGEEIAVAELARLPADEKTEQEVARAVAMLPELHLSQRIAAAALIVQGTVTEIARATDIPRTGSEHDPAWLRASIDVQTVLKGEIVQSPARQKERKRYAVVSRQPRHSIQGRAAARERPEGSVSVASGGLAGRRRASMSPRIPRISSRPVHCPPSAG